LYLDLIDLIENTYRSKWENVIVTPRLQRKL